MDTVNISTKIEIKPIFFHKNIINHIYNKIKKIHLLKCTKEYGHILDINENIIIKDQYINRVNSEVIFVVEFLATIFKPEKGKKASGKVCMIYKDGIFLNIVNNQKILIPTNYLDHYYFNNDIFIHNENNDIKIKIGDTVETIIIDSKYYNQNFSCFGKLIT